MSSSNTVIWKLKRLKAFFFLYRLNLDHALNITYVAFDKHSSSSVLDPNIIIHVKRIAAGAIIAMNTSSDADGKISHAFPVAIVFMLFIFMI